MFKCIGMVACRHVIRGLEEPHGSRIMDRTPKHQTTLVSDMGYDPEIQVRILKIRTSSAAFAR